MLTDKYIVDFAALHDGNHEFCFELDDTFFESTDKIELKGVKLVVDLVLNKQKSQLLLDFSIHGSVELECDRCLENYVCPIDDQHSVIVSVGSSEETENDEDIVVIGLQETSLDVESFVYDFVILSLPMRRVHPEDITGNSSCDPVMLERLNQHLLDDATDIGNIEQQLN